MSIQNKLSWSASSSAGGLSLNGSVSETGATEINIDQNFAASSSDSSVSIAWTVANTQSLLLVSDKGCTIKTNGTGTSEVQTVTITGTPTGGTFTLGFGSTSGFGAQITSPIAYNAIASAVQSALQALSTIGSGNVTCSGGPLPGTPVTATFAGTLANTNVAQMTSNSGGLTGGSTPTATVTTTTPGLPSNTITLQPGIPLVWDASAGYYSNPFTVNVTGWYVSCTSAARLQAKILTS